MRTQPVRRSATGGGEDDGAARADGSFARSAMRLVALFESLAKSEEGVSLAELSATIGAPKSSLLGILRSMVAAGYMEHGHGLYRLGPKSFRLAADILAVRRFPNLVRPILQELAAKSGETVFLVVLDRLAQR
ncbi:MAG TPA: helix-turn-helix domain-containing protein, partial [Stellaceae bacterium]|nr:helix-turn-helix domain-containing protein [Stellaceae bacterium]